MVEFKRLGNSRDMSNGEVIEKTDTGIQVRFFTKRHTWDIEKRVWIAGTFIRTIHSLKRMIVHEDNNS